MRTAIKILPVMLFTQITFSAFCDAFVAYGREEQFSFEAKKAIFGYLEELSEDIGQPIELDIIALCVEYSEVEDMEDLHNGFGYDSDDYQTIEDVANATCVIFLNDDYTGESGFVIQDF